MRGLRRLTLTLALALAAGVAGPSCDSVSDAVSVDPADVVRLSASVSSAPADGATRVTITVQVPMGLEPTARTITLSTNVGGFLGTSGTSAQLTLDPDSSGYAYAELVAPTRPGTATVQARVSTFASTLRVEFVRAEPTRIDVDPGASAIPARAIVSTTVTAHLLRSPGVASEETAVTFSARDASGNSLGTFTGITLSDASGHSTARFSAGDTSYRGRVVIEARVGNVIGSAPLDVVN